MKISELINDLKNIENKHGDMDLLLHVDNGKEDYIISSCGRAYSKEQTGREKYQATFLGVHKIDELLLRDFESFASEYRKQIEDKYFVQ